MMRTDEDGDTYVLPTLAACCPQCRLDQQLQCSASTHCSAVGVVTVKADDDDDDDRIGTTTTTTIRPSSPFEFVREDIASFVTLKLEQLPLLTEEGEQTPIGARGWYASAVLSAMLLCGHETLHQDIFHPSSSDNNYYSNNNNNGNVERLHQRTMMIELGSGVLGLVGMTLAWIMAQKGCGSSTKIVMTDYDTDVLQQLDKNVKETKRRFDEYFGGDEDDAGERRVPLLESAHLDWNEYDQEQPLLLTRRNVKDGDNNSTGESNHDYNDDDNAERPYTISFVCGAALVYTEDTVACADQIAKILNMYPQATVWVVQWPRKGWFHVFQLQLQQKYHCRIEKFSPTKDIHPYIHELAQMFMPPQIELDVEHIKAVRITSHKKI
jgi:hypothetical protein